MANNKPISPQKQTTSNQCRGHAGAQKRVSSLKPHKCPFLGPLAANTPHKLHVLREDGHTLGVNSAEVGVFKQNGEICLRRGLGRHNGVRLEAEIGFEILCNL